MPRMLLVLLLILLAASLLWLGRDVAWDSLRQNQAFLMAGVSAHPIWAASIFLLSYVLTAALSLPQGALLTVVGGLLFGPVAGFVLTIVGATAGATILLVVLRFAFGATLARQRHRIPEKLRARLVRDGFSYLLALRLVPLFPFWMVNLAAAVADIRLVVFVPATLLGIAPTSFVMSWIGAGIDGVLTEGRTPDLSIVFTPRILLPLMALAVLSLIPVLLRRRSHA